MFACCRHIETLNRRSNVTGAMVVLVTLGIWYTGRASESHNVSMWRVAGREDVLKGKEGSASRRSACKVIAYGLSLVTNNC